MKSFTIVSAKKLLLISVLTASSLGLSACSSADDAETVETTTPDATVVTSDTATVVTDDTMVTDADDDVAVATAEE